jgi:hypothetical protein
MWGVRHMCNLPCCAPTPIAARPEDNAQKYSAEALAEQKRVCELLAQSRELLKQMQGG